MSNAPLAALCSALVLICQLLTFSALLGNDILSRTLQILLYGPFLLANSSLRLARDAWGLPIPATLFGGFPGWMNGLLFLMNWLLLSLLVFIIGKQLSRRSHGRP